MLCEDPNPFQESKRQEDIIIQFSTSQRTLVVCSFNDGISSLSSLASRLQLDHSPFALALLKKRQVKSQNRRVQAYRREDRKGHRLDNKLSQKKGVTYILF